MSRLHGEPAPPFRVCKRATAQDVGKLLLLQNLHFRHPLRSYVAVAWRAFPSVSGMQKSA